MCPVTAITIATSHGKGVTYVNAHNAHTHHVQGTPYRILHGVGGAKMGAGLEVGVGQGTGRTW